MTEQEWLTCRDPIVLLAYLGKAADQRRLRLLACACCRRIWNLITNSASRRAVEAAELMADQNLPANVQDEIILAAQNIDELDYALYRLDPDPPVTAEELPALAALCCVLDFAEPDCNYSNLADVPRICSDAVFAIENLKAYVNAWRESFYYLAYEDCDLLVANRTSGPTCNQEQSAQAQLVRDVFGNPFRPARFHVHWRTPKTSTLARAIYAERHFTDLPILADALEEAGCTSADILGHLRSAGEHVRGCWALDLALGKE